ncbi:MAG: PH domain-containing protein [Candidatus Peregrinibacteria bacterium]|nr:PH domain-containing protein [Candidatus Peregrinibacteria bacterium]
MERDHHDFKGQLKYEHFQFFFRRHWVRFLQPIFLNIPAGLLILVILYFMGRVTLMLDFIFLRAFYVLFTMSLVVSYFILGFQQLINFYFDLCIITDTRVIIIKKTVFLKNNSDALDLTKIQDIAVESQGIFSNYLHYGKLIITLSTSAPPLVLNYVPNPHFYLEWMNRVKREHILKRRSDRDSGASLSQKSNYLQEINNLNL